MMRRVGRVDTSVAATFARFAFVFGLIFGVLADEILRAIL